MFKMMFRMMTMAVFFVFLTVGLAIWKGGEPFRWLGEGTVTVGQKITGFGDFVDELIKGSKQVQKTVKDLKETVNGSGK